jgi:prephenate dehydrogenase
MTASEPEVRMKSCETAAVIGLGLVGGSLARDLAERGVRVRAYDADAEHLASALTEGVIHEALDATLAGIVGADVVVIAVPVDAALDVLSRIVPFAASTRLITDVGSTKARIVARAGEVGMGERFVGSHPMAGGHRSGWDASRTGLFDGAPVYLCPAPGADEATHALADAFWRELGARPICVDADRHDRQLAWTSHLPHVVSTALALVLAQSGVGRGDLGPGGRDVTRLAGSSPDVWTAIAHDNAAALDGALAAAEREIAAFRTALAQSDTTALHERFSTARNWFDD